MCLSEKTEENKSLYLCTKWAIELSEYDIEYKIAKSQVLDSENSSADALATLALTSDPELKRVITVEAVNEPNIWWM